MRLFTLMFAGLCAIALHAAERLVLVSASCGKNILAITEADGSVLWSHKTAGGQRGHSGHHDVQLLGNGNILFHGSWTKTSEITRDKTVVWEFAEWDLVGNGLACWEVIEGGKAVMLRQKLAALAK
jgi:hypothetical protein